MTQRMVFVKCTQHGQSLLARIIDTGRDTALLYPVDKALRAPSDRYALLDTGGD